VAGAFLIVIQPVQPRSGASTSGSSSPCACSAGWDRSGARSSGAFVLGIAESFTATFFGPSWAPAVSFGILLAALAFKPAGLFGR
jgi:branched-chain amino acid transport system permease protein